MPFCPNCGTNLENNEKFCPNCGKNMQENTQSASQSTNQTYTQPNADNVSAYSAPYNAQATPRSLNTAQLVWSIVNILMCCLPLGIVALIFTIIAKDAPDDETEARKLKTAKACNIISTVGGAIIIVLYIVLGVVAAATEYAF